MRFAGTLMVVVAVAVASVLWALSDDMADEIEANTEARSRYENAVADFERSSRARQERRTSEELASARCWGAVEARFSAWRDAQLVVVHGSGAPKGDLLDVTECAGVGVAHAIWVGRRRDVSRLLKRTKAKRSDATTFPDGREWVWSERETARVFPKPSTVAENAELKQAAGVVLTPPGPEPARPAAPTLFRIRTRNYTGLSFAALAVLGLPGLLLLAVGQLRIRSRDRPSIALPDTLPAAQRRTLEQMANDRDDIQRFMREFYLVFVRLNPVNRQVFTFGEKIGAIKKNMDDAQRCALVTQAIAEVDLSQASHEFHDFDAAIDPIVADVFHDLHRELGKVLPNYRIHLPRLRDADDLAGQSVSQLRQALQSTRGQLVTIERHFRQLQEHLPRYQKIMNRTGLIDQALGFLAGYFGGDAGVLGAELWNDWRGKSDEAFVNTFSAAVDEFCESAFIFTRDTEAAVSPVAATIAADLADAYDCVIEGLAHLAAQGTDVRPICSHLRRPEPLDTDTRDVLAMVLGNLREQGLSGASDRNLRALLGL